jgi:hypothetical protein
VTRTQKWMGSVGCFGQIENIKRQSLSYILIDMIRMEEDRLTSALESIGGLPRKELNL